MQTILEHTKSIGILKTNKIDLKFIKECNIKDIFRCCKQIQENHLQEYLYENRTIIQSELILDDKFINYLIQMTYKKVDMQKIEDLIIKLQDKQKKVSDYELNVLIQVLNNIHISSNSLYNYLEYFSHKITSKDQQDIVGDNLFYFDYQGKVNMSDLNEAERNLFLESFMSDRNLIPIENIKQVCNFLVQDNELKKIILFLFTNNLSLPLNIEEYELLHKDSKNIYTYIHQINKMIDHEQMYQLLLRWKENGFNIYDLKILEVKLHGITKPIIDKFIMNKSSYINFIFGNKLKNFPLQYVNGEREKLLIYAISNNKKSFLNMIQENSQTFFNIYTDSILYNEDFYKKYVNINTLTLKNLEKLSYMSGYNSKINLLEKNNYTFQEIEILYNVSQQYIKMYNCLLDLKIDQRILIIKQLLKKNLLNSNITDENIKQLAQKLKIQHLYYWMERNFKHIKDIDAVNTINILIYYDKIKKFIPQISNKIELQYVIRNLEAIQQYDDLDSIKENIENIDEYWKMLVSMINFDKNFIEENKKHIKNFLLNNGAELALTYYKNNFKREQETFKKIIKAELMGQFKKLKYYTDDLHKEIDFKLENNQINEWCSNNLHETNGQINVGEYDDFYSTMILGETPKHTCLSYKNGAYNHCLMACFDSNKKILYAKINDKIVARAMVRLTKGSYSGGKTNNKEKFSFVDLENIENTEKRNTEIKEYLTIFLERPYISGVSTECEEKIKKMFISLLEKKAINMNATLVLSKDYSGSVNQNYVKTKYYIYISKSKAGSQYLDSLNGENSIIDEGQYKNNSFIIWQK